MVVGGREETARSWDRWFSTRQPQPQGLMPASHVWQCLRDRVTTDTSPFPLHGVGQEGKGVHFSLSSWREVFQRSFPQIAPLPTIKGPSAFLEWRPAP